MSMRPGNRKTRKSIAIIGEGLTEYRYVDDMRTTERYRFSLVPGIPKHSDVDDIVNLANERVKAGYDYVLCLIDMDVIEGNHEKMEHYKALKNKEYANYDAVAQELKKHIPNYDKTEVFFNKTHIYRELKETGNMERAIELSRELNKLHETEPEVYKSYTQMYKLFDIIAGIVKS